MIISLIPSLEWRQFSRIALLVGPRHEVVVLLVLVGHADVIEDVVQRIDLFG